MARTPADNGYGLFTGMQAALAPPGNPPPKLPKGRPPGNGALGKPVIIPRNGLARLNSQKPTKATLNA